MPKGVKQIQDDQILPLIAAGMANKQIAAALGANQRTIESAVSRLLKQKECANRVELAMKWRDGLT